MTSDAEELRAVEELKARYCRNMPGNPDNDRGWAFTDWFDTEESERLLAYQQHHWSETLAWVQEENPGRRKAIRVSSRREHRGPYADPWSLIAQVYGGEVLAATRSAESELPWSP